VDAIALKTASGIETYTVQQFVKSSAIPAIAFYRFVAF